MTSAVSLACRSLLERRFNLELEREPAARRPAFRAASFRLPGGSTRPRQPLPRAAPVPAAPRPDRGERLRRTLTEQLPAAVREPATSRLSSSAATSASPMAAARSCAASTSPSSAAKSWCIMGPSGSGKSTLLRLINHLEACRPRRDHGRRRACRLRADPAALAADARSCQGARRGPHRHGVPALQPVRAPDRAARTSSKRRCRSIGEDPRQARESRASGCSTASASPARRSSAASPVGRPAAARRHRPRAGHVAAPDAVRRADLGARSGTGRRGAGGDPPARRGGMTMIVVTHEMRFAREVADRVVFMDEGEHRRAGHAGRGARQSEARAHPALPAHGRARRDRGRCLRPASSERRRRVDPDHAAAAPSAGTVGMGQVGAEEEAAALGMVCSRRRRRASARPRGRSRPPRRHARTGRTSCGWRRG